MATKTRPFGELFAEPVRNGLTRPKAVRGAGVKMVNMGELFAYPRLYNAPINRVSINQFGSPTIPSAKGRLALRAPIVSSGGGREVFAFLER